MEKKNFQSFFTWRGTVMSGKGPRPRKGGRRLPGREGQELNNGITSSLSVESIILGKGIFSRAEEGIPKKKRGKRKY